MHEHPSERTGPRVKNPYVAVWSCATNAALYIDDPGPAALPDGNRLEPRTVPRHQVYRDFYARLLVLDLAADPDLLDAAITAARRGLRGGYSRLIITQMGAAHARQESWPTVLERLRPGELHALRRVHRLGLEIARAARQIVTDAGADTDPYARARLLAGLDHTLTDEALAGLLPPAARAANAADLTERLAAIDDEQQRNQDANGETK